MSIISRIIDRLRGSDAPDAPERLPSPDELVVLTAPEGEPEAMMLRGLLLDRGIPSMVRNRDAASAQSGGMGPSWAYELLVLRRDLRRAREALQLPEDGAADDAG